MTMIYESTNRQEAVVVPTLMQTTRELTGARLHTPIIAAATANRCWRRTRRAETRMS
jgi:hypothetical protein